MNDRIRFLNFSPAEVRALREGLGTVWPIQEVRSYGGAEEFKFRDYPWAGKANGDDKSRRLVKRMLESLYDMGWVLQAAVDISKKSLDEDTLVFRLPEPTAAAVRLALHLVRLDRQDENCRRASSRSSGRSRFRVHVQPQAQEPRA